MPMSDPAPNEALTGYRRRLRVEAGPGAVVAQLEDDYHCMSVTLEHDGAVVSKVVPVMHREPWTTCPGAILKLRETFTGVPLAEVTARRDKTQNCTHLHDLAVLGASRALRPGGTVFDIFASDPIDGRRVLEVRRDGAMVMQWAEQDNTLVEPEAVAGRTLFTLRDWIAALPEDEREAARLLQWGSIVAHGRGMSRPLKASAEGMPPNCYTFQPERAREALRVGEVVDFSAIARAPLEGVGADEIERVRES